MIPCSPVNTTLSCIHGAQIKIQSVQCDHSPPFLTAPPHTKMKYFWLFCKFAICLGWVASKADSIPMDLEMASCECQPFTPHGLIVRLRIAESSLMAQGRKLGNPHLRDSGVTTQELIAKTALASCPIFLIFKIKHCVRASQSWLDDTSYKDESWNETGREGPKYTAAATAGPGHLQSQFHLSLISFG